MKNQRQDIAIRIRGLREAADMPLEEAARGLGMTPADYARCETGEADASLGLIPEISGNRLMVSIRFMRLGDDDRLHSGTDDCPFELTLCA